MKVGILKKLESLANRQRKPRDLTIISFESIPVCDEQTDGHAAYMLRSSIAERDRN